MPNQTEIDQERRQLLSRLLDLQATIADLNGEAESIKAELRSLPAGDYTANGAPVLRIVPTRRFEVTKAVEHLDPQQREAALTVTWDPVLVKRHLTPAQIDDCMVEVGKPKVVLL